MKDSLRLQLQRLTMRLAELDAHLADPHLSADIARYRTVARDQSEAAALVQRFQAYERREAVSEAKSCNRSLFQRNKVRPRVLL